MSLVEFLDTSEKLNDIKLITIREGSTEVFIPDPNVYVKFKNEYLPTSLPVFYNPIMEINRDISIILVKTYLKNTDEDKIYYLEAMAGTGIRGFRILNEINDDRLVVIMNDASPRAYDLMKFNARKLGYDSDRLILFQKEANYLFRELRSKLGIRPNIIDIDPYGTPAPYVFNALHCLKSNNGMLLITATDTAPLVGKFPNAALRKYGCKITRNPFGREIAVRALSYMVGREGSIISIKVKPILGIFLHHFVRVAFISERGRRKADDFWKSIGWVSFCPICNNYFVTRGLENIPNQSCTIRGHGNTELLGPLWIDPIFDAEYVKNIIDTLGRETNISTKNREKLLEILKNEILVNDVLLYYNIQDIARKLGVSTPVIMDVVEKIREKGFRASKTHFDPTAIKTDAPLSIVVRTVREIAETRISKF